MIIEEVWRPGRRFDGWSEHFSYDLWIAPTGAGLALHRFDLDSFTTREREYAEVLP